MKPVYQREGDWRCFAASLASILECGLDDIPQYPTWETDPQGSEGKRIINEWLRERGLMSFEVPIWMSNGYDINRVFTQLELLNTETDVHFVFCGQGDRSDNQSHSVVANKTGIVHDPNIRDGPIPYLAPVTKVGNIRYPPHYMTCFIFPLGEPWRP